MISGEMHVEDVVHVRIENGDQDNEMDDDDKDPKVVLENVIELTLLPEGKVPVVDVAELDDYCKELLDDKEEEEEFTTKHTFFDLDQDSMKILSYPDLKTNIKKKLCCQVCAVERHIGKITMEQKPSN